MSHWFKKLYILTGISLMAPAVWAQTKIDRKALVQRHNVVLHTTDSLSSLSLGNGKFAFTADITGLQTFPEYYEKGVPLGTQSEWGWHSFKDTAGYKFEETLKPYQINDRQELYSVQWNEPKRNRDASNWFRQNVHRLQLGNLGFVIYKKNGAVADIKDVKNISQKLDMWTGALQSHFEVEGVPVEVTTYVNQQQDEIAVKVNSALLQQGRLKVQLRYPFPTNEWGDYGTNRAHPEKHSSGIIQQSNNQALINHRLDDDQYFTQFNWSGSAKLESPARHQFVLTPGKTSPELTFTCVFAPIKPISKAPTFAETALNNQKAWPAFWQSGGAIDFSGSTDPRAQELERRVILSQWLTRIQSAGAYPPQETGLVYNSWYGKPHLEMHWWHSLHYALWQRPALLEKSMAWYHQPKVEGMARKIAQRQGYEGVRWQKMTDPEGNESPSSVGAFLVWQQPHFITFAESVYRLHHDKAVLNRYKDLVFATADFVASFAYYDKVKSRYLLGKGIILAQERYKPEDTFNPTYELQYWYWALQTAQEWRKRLGLQPNAKYTEVMSKLSVLPQKDGVYLAAESAPDSYTNPKLLTDHPSVLATYGMLPYNQRLDTAVMKKTFDLVWKVWDWKDTWGWDFPMTAMAATRLGMPDKAIDALFMPIKTNTYLPNGHNFQDDRLRIYLPGNGGLLTAVALMCAGWDGCKTTNPGFLKDGTWKVKWEGLQPMF